MIWSTPYFNISFVTALWNQCFPDFTENEGGKVIQVNSLPTAGLAVIKTKVDANAKAIPSPLGFCAFPMHSVRSVRRLSNWACPHLQGWSWEWSWRQLEEKLQNKTQHFPDEANLLVTLVGLNFKYSSLWPTGNLHYTDFGIKKYGSCKYKIYIKTQKINPENSREQISIVILCDFYIRFITSKNLYETITQPHTCTPPFTHPPAQSSKPEFVLAQTINILKVN